jgi:aspartyl/asparaginyl-tRNA synthetase
VSEVLTCVLSVSQDFKVPKRPFKRMQYTEAIAWLKEHDVKKEDGSYYEFGEVRVSMSYHNTTSLVENLRKQLGQAVRTGGTT